ncbi:MAG: ABC transporter ATP-binding protein [Kiritimatiellae bacterium]|nr:ABC transporter ATP-binding protein [Kiritimatiellia bacterium]
MIHIENLSKSFGPVRAVRDLTLFVPAGELFCFIGPNGAGKTTTIKLLTGLLHPSSGSIRIDGKNIAEEAIEAKKVIGYIPDMPYLYDRLTAAEFFEFTGELHRIPPATISVEMQNWFGLFGLFEYQHSLIQDLSHGMRQRLIYASTFLHAPKVLFVDEPLIGLDPRSIRLIKDLLREKARGGMTVFLTTHILALAEDIADRIGIISRGELIALGTLDELRKRSKTQGHLEDLFLELTEPERGPG